MSDKDVKKGSKGGPKPSSKHEQYMDEAPAKRSDEGVPEEDDKEGVVRDSRKKVIPKELLVECPVVLDGGEKCGQPCRGFQGYMAHAWAKHGLKKEEAQQRLLGDDRVIEEPVIQFDEGVEDMSGKVISDVADTGDKTRLKGQIRALVNKVRRLPRDLKENLLPEVETAKEYIRVLGNRKKKLTVDDFKDIEEDYIDNIKPIISEAIEEYDEENGRKKKRTGEDDVEDIDDFLDGVEDREYRELRRQERELEREEKKRLMKLKLKKRRKELEREIEKLDNPSYDDGRRGRRGRGGGNGGNPVKITVNEDGSRTFEFSPGGGGNGDGGMDVNSMLMMMMMQNQQGMGGGGGKGGEDRLTTRDMLELMEKRSENQLEQYKTMDEKKSMREREIEQERIRAEREARENERKMFQMQLETLEKRLDAPSDFEMFKYYNEMAKTAGLGGETPEEAMTRMELQKTQTGLNLLASKISNMDQNINKVTDVGIELLQDAVRKGKREEHEPIDGGQTYEVEYADGSVETTRTGLGPPAEHGPKFGSSENASSVHDGSDEREMQEMQETNDEIAEGYDMNDDASGGERRMRQDPMERKKSMKKKILEEFEFAHTPEGSGDAESE